MRDDAIEYPPERVHSRGVLPDDTVSPTEHRGLPRPRLPVRCSVWLPHGAREPGQARRAPYPHLRDARTRCLGDAQARSDRVPVGRARRGRVVRGGVHGQARTQRRPRGHLRRPARHAPRRSPPRMSRVGAVHLRRGQPSLRGGIDHRRRRRGDQGSATTSWLPPASTSLPTTARRTPPTSPTLRVALGIDSWNVYGVSYGSKLALIVLRDHPQGIRSVVLDSVSPPNEQHRRDVVVGSGQFVQGDLRCVCCPAPPAPPPTRTWKRTSRPR